MRATAQQQASATALVAEINRPHWCIKDCARIESALTQIIKSEPSGTEPLLWRGILRRICGCAAAQADLEAVLVHDPGNRLAALNLAALPITCLDVRLRQGSLEQSVELVERFLQDRPDDYFAQLIRATLVFLAEHSSTKFMEALEDLYVRHPGHSATPSLMAALQQKNGRRGSANDFAREALRQNPHDAVAHNILELNGKLDHPKYRIKLKRFSQAITETGFDVVFMAPCAQQDREGLSSISRTPGPHSR